MANFNYGKLLRSLGVFSAQDDRIKGILRHNFRVPTRGTLRNFNFDISMGPGHFDRHCAKNEKVL